MNQILKHLLFLVFVFPTEIKSQNHTLGFNVGTTNLVEPTVEPYYSFNIYHLYSKLDYALSFGNSSDYKCLHHIGSILGFQTGSQRKFIFHTGMGIRFLTATNYPRTETSDNRRFVENQWGPIVNIGASYNLRNSHFINFDHYVSNPHVNGVGKYSSSSNGYFELRFMLGYAYRFMKVKSE